MHSRWSACTNACPLFFINSAGIPSTPTRFENLYVVCTQQSRPAANLGRGTGERQLFARFQLCILLNFLLLYGPIRVFRCPPVGLLFALLAMSSLFRQSLEMVLTTQNKQEKNKKKHKMNKLISKTHKTHNNPKLNLSQHCAVPSTSV